MRTHDDAKPLKNVCMYVGVRKCFMHGAWVYRRRDPNCMNVRADMCSTSWYVLNRAELVCLTRPPRIRKRHMCVLEPQIHVGMYARSCSLLCADKRRPADRVLGGMPPVHDARRAPLPWAVEQPTTRSEFDRAVRELVRREADVEVRILEYVRHREHKHGNAWFEAACSPKCMI